MAERRRRPGRGGAAVVTGNRIGTRHSRPRRPAQHRRCCPRFRGLTQHLHQLGPRPVGELLLALADAHGIEGDILARLEKFAELDPVAVARLGGRTWPPVPLSEVA
jgi:hypothetical protein